MAGTNGEASLLLCKRFNLALAAAHVVGSGRVSGERTRWLRLSSLARSLGFGVRGLRVLFYVSVHSAFEVSDLLREGMGMRAL